MDKSLKTKNLCNYRKIIQPLTMWHLFGLEYASEVTVTCQCQKNHKGLHVAILCRGARDFLVAWDKYRSYVEEVPRP